MGIAFCCCVDLSIFDTADYINLFSILVNVILTLWIVSSIQDKSNNRRFLKDHYICEMKEIRNEYKLCLSNLYNGKVSPKNVIPWFKLMNIKVTDYMEDVSSIYSLNKEYLNCYQNDLRDLITDNNDFILQFNNDKLNLTIESKNALMKFQQENNKLFNKVIVKINNS